MEALDRRSITWRGVLEGQYTKPLVGACMLKTLGKSTVDIRFRGHQIMQKANQEIRLELHVNTTIHNVLRSNLGQTRGVTGSSRGPPEALYLHGRCTDRPLTNT